MSGRKRRHHSDDEEEAEGGGEVVDSGEELESEHRRGRSKKKSKKHKKDKKSRKKAKRRRRSEASENEEDEEEAGSTDREAVSTPEVGQVSGGDDEESALAKDDVVERRRESRHKQQRPRAQDYFDDEDEVQPDPKGRSRSPPPPSKQSRRAVAGENGNSAAVSIPETKGGGSAESLSVEETNKLRASLGLPPLKESKPKPKPEADDGAAAEAADDGKEGTAVPNSDVRHKPAVNLTEKSATEKMRERLNQRKMKRQQEAKLMSVSTLGAADEVDDTEKWLKRQKKKEKERKEAEKRAKMLAELDDEFGVGNLVKEDRKVEKEKEYGSRNLSGLKVEHASHKFKEGSSVILTLKDSGVLDDDARDTLVNVNMIDDERVDKRKEDIKKAKTGGYNAYDQEEVDEETGEIRRKNMLDKYDEEIDGEAKQSFEIGRSGVYSEEKEKEIARAKIREKLAAKHVETLEMPQLRVASDYFTEEEVVKFKKPKKKKKKVKRKMLKADDLLALDAGNDPVASTGDKNSSAALPMDIDDDDIKPNMFDNDDLCNVKVEADDNRDLELALKKARRLKQKRTVEEDKTARLIEENRQYIKDEPEYETTGAEFINTFTDDKTNSNIILNETSEFCRHLGAWRSHEGTGLGESVSKDILDFEKSLSRGGGGGNEKSGSDHRRRRRSSSDSDSDDPMEGSSSGSNRREKQKKTVILDEEPDLQSGMAAAILMATNKGYWETAEKSVKSGNLKHLEARNYTIDDKAGRGDHDDDRRGGRRGRRGMDDDRYSNGPLEKFSEKSDYKPNVKLEYMDDNGRMMNQKEAFRHLSHKFHGKGSGKIKTEKRMKKIMEESLMKNMSSTDTPLQTMEKMREKTREAATPYLVLTGNKVQATDLKKKY